MNERYNKYVEIAKESWGPAICGKQVMCTGMTTLFIYLLHAHYLFSYGSVSRIVSTNPATARAL